MSILIPMTTYLKKNKPQRRTVILGLAAACIHAAAPVWALSTAQAKKLVGNVVDDINTVIQSGQSEPAMLAEFEKIFQRYADVKTIARYALGLDARSASPAQMAAFTDAFSSYFSRKYGAQFNEFVGGRIDVKSTKAVKSFHEVKAIVEFRGGSKMELIFLVSDRSGRPLFFNIFMEGINMLLTERTEIGAMLDQRRGDLKALISDLEKMG